MLLNLVSPPRPIRISLTPLIDVVFILLLFFMLTSSFMPWRAVDIPLVSDGSSLMSESKVLTVLVRSDGTLDLQNESVDLEKLARQIDPAEQISVQVRATAETSLQQVISVIDALTLLGLTDVKYAGVAREKSNG